MTPDALILTVSTDSVFKKASRLLPRLRFAVNDETSRDGEDRSGDVADQLVSQLEDRLGNQMFPL